jgi:hypothetical protein
VNARVTSDTRPHPVSGTWTPVRQSEPVTRRYRPDTAALDELVEALYQLLMDSPADGPGRLSAPPQPTCFPATHE